VVAVAALLLAGIVVVGSSQGTPAQDVRLLSGAAWLTSSKVGQVTLLDGSSAEVAAQVQVAPAGDTLAVAQQGSTAYAVDQSVGTVRRVDGGTFEVSSPVEPIPDTRSGLTVLPGPDVVYAVDNRRGVLANANPRDLKPRGDLVTLANELKAGSAAVDDAGTLWAIDAKTGDLTYVVDGAPLKRPHVTEPGPSMLVISDRQPVVVDIAARKLTKIDPSNGRSGVTINLDLRPTDTVEVSGSAHSDRLYLVASRGVLTVCKLSTDKCDTTIPLTNGNSYGPAVEAGDQVFVPDYTTGQVLIIDAKLSRVVGKATVMTPPGEFQLLTRDGVVFYNDTNSERAGVVQFDGTVRQAPKYNPADPRSGLSGPQKVGSQSSPSNLPAQPNQSDQPGQANQPGGPAQPTVPPSSAQVNAPETPRTPQPPRTPDPPSQTPSQPKPPDPTTPTKPKPQLQIAMSKASPMAKEAVTLQVNNVAGAAPVSTQWTFGDGDTGNSTITTHKWLTARPTPYLVTATVKMLDDPDEYTASVNVTVSEIPKNRLTVTVSGGGTVKGGATPTNPGVSCPSTCAVDFEENTVVTLTATPAATYQLGTWSGVCSGRAATCDVTLNAAKTVNYAFELIPIPKNTLTITAPNGGAIDRVNGGSCPPTCVIKLDPGTVVDLNARSLSQDFYMWGGDCSNSRDDPHCQLTMNGDKNVSARYLPKPYLNSVSCQVNPGRKFSCVADGGPKERTYGTTWTYDGLGKINHSLTLNDSCGSTDFDVSVNFNGLTKSTRVTNCR
jgi:hypothetical protein